MHVHTHMYEHCLVDFDTNNMHMVYSCVAIMNYGLIIQCAICVGLYYGRCLCWWQCSVDNCWSVCLAECG